MKVSTDACLLGALVNDNITAAHILDIGTGTGLLSLMMAQKFPSAIIEAVEIEQNAFQQAQENFSNSIWKDRLKVHLSSIQNFAKNNSAQKYDLIISNPPFFENDLLSPDKKTNIAKHSTDLTLKELLACAFELLNDNGFIYLLLPFRRMDELKQHGVSIIHLQDNPQSGIKRSVFMLQKNNFQKLIEEKFVLKNEQDNYSNAFLQLMQPFYLNL